MQNYVFLKKNNTSLKYTYQQRDAANGYCEVLNMNLNIWFDIPSSDVNIRVDLLSKFPSLKNCRGGHSFFLLLSPTPLYISFNWSILVLIIITYITWESRGFCAALFVKTQINVKCKVVYEAKENFVKNFWLTGKNDVSVFWYGHASKHRESDAIKGFFVQFTQIDQNKFF